MACTSLVVIAQMALMVFYSPVATAETCANGQFRVGASASLPDCRAYELVTPANTGAHRPTAANYNVVYNAFPSAVLSPDGESVMFQTVGGALPGTDGSGITDRYQAVRTSTGWTTKFIGPTPVQTQRPEPGGITPDQRYYFLDAAGEGFSKDYGLFTEQAGGNQNNWLHLADGSFEPIGVGSLGVDYFACGLHISPDARHVIYQTGACSALISAPVVRLELDAPEGEAMAVYDRSPGGANHVVSLLPGNATPSTPSTFEGASADGSTVLFANPVQENRLPLPETKLYARRDNTDTVEVVADPNGDVEPAGVSANGEFIFYVLNGDIFSFSTGDQNTTAITSVGDVKPTIISPDGSHVYFISDSQIGGEGAFGEPNLYVWDRETGVTTFVATVASTDVDEGETFGSPNPSLVRWVHSVAASEMSGTNGPAIDTARTTPNGNIIVFESSAQLTSYDNAGHIEIYRYVLSEANLSCVSCRPDGTPATGDASLQTQNFGVGDRMPPLPAIYPVANISDDGNMVVFQSRDQLVPGDIGSTQRVYRWRDGDVARISTGQSIRDNYLYGVSPDGSDILFLTNDHLLPQDENSAGAIYDARVDGGFPTVVGGPGSCVADACQGIPLSPPPNPSMGSAAFSGPGNLHKRHHSTHCRKHHHRRHGRCVKRKRGGGR
jgi:hypothetical protein